MLSQTFFLLVFQSPSSRASKVKRYWGGAGYSVQHECFLGMGGIVFGVGKFLWLGRGEEGQQTQGPPRVTKGLVTPLPAS